MNAIEMVEAYRAGRLSPVEVVTAALAAIGRDTGFNAWVHVAAEPALQEARESEARWRAGAPLGALDGVPVGVKDLLAVAGQPMRRGSMAFAEDHVPDEDAPIVARLREAGAVLIGKTATPDAGCKLDTTSLVHGTTVNPYDTALTAGGSSGGSAVALALGHVPVAIGTDGAGSIRVPAAFCGVFGLKPSTGLVPAPVGPFWPHAVTGPMTRTVLDTALALNVVTGADVRDPYALPCPVADWVAEAKRGVAGLRVAVAESWSGTGASADVAAAVNRAAARLQAAGAVVEEAGPDWPCDPLAPFMVFWRCMYAQSVAMMPAAQAERIDPVIKEIVAASGGISRAEFQAAMVQRDALAGAMAKFHQTYDLLLCPVMPGGPWAAGRATPAPHDEDDWAWCPFAYPFNMTRQPAASVPMGRDAAGPPPARLPVARLPPAGLPVAVQLVAGARRDDLVLRGSLVLETG
jgi:aspartyl-tRNA(Asn)/glutamyl-tRNA(Gln) amidotransferase subunit A